MFVDYAEWAEGCILWILKGKDGNFSKKTLLTGATLENEYIHLHSSLISLSKESNNPNSKNY